MKFIDEQDKATSFAELGHIQYYRKAYMKAITNYVQSLTLSIKDVEKGAATVPKRIKKIPSLVVLRLSVCFTEVAENVLAALVLQLASKTPYKLIFDLFSKMKHEELNTCPKYHKFIYKVPVVEFLTCEYNKKKLKSNEKRLIEFIESTDIFTTTDRHMRKQLKQRTQIEFIYTLNKLYDGFALTH
eukprot:TRINITY_DN1407_c0_g9_i1.p1 TRINITY_DN1407_c0_g9~~TRINITY_DN1407_c0_g9_i1.p1  ORF type:complete len:186 (+),score=50.02 TRINITY_DN1407_c0_g9_i1:1160-1717(+)